VIAFGLFLALSAPGARAQAGAASTAASLDWPTIQNEALQDLSAYIRVDTTNPPGNEDRAADWYAKIFKAEGIPYDIAESAGVVQTVDAGFTDSHFFRDKGILSYGFEPFAITQDDDERVHGNNERIPVKNFADGVRLMWEVVDNFSRTN